jgi:hypothetical protein
MKQHDIATPLDASLDFLTGNCGLSPSTLVRPTGNPAKGPVRSQCRPRVDTGTHRFRTCPPTVRLDNWNNDARWQAGSAGQWNTNEGPDWAAAAIPCA